MQPHVSHADHILTCPLLACPLAGKYVAGQRAWAVDTKADIALPCATQVTALLQCASVLLLQ